jgi:hemerythrin
MAMQTYLKRLLAYVHYRFATEEGSMANHGYPELDAHAGRHAGFKEKIRKLIDQAKEGAEPGLDELLDFLVHCIVFHVQDEDRKYVRFFRERGNRLVLHSTAGGEERGQDVLALWQEKHLALEVGAHLTLLRDVAYQRSPERESARNTS